jgi:hypothetical protein
LQEALAGGPSKVSFVHRSVVSEGATNGKQTVLLYQKVENQVYFDRACFKKSVAPRSNIQCP